VSDKLEVWRFASGALGIWTWGRLTTVETDANGSFSTTTQLPAPGTVYAVRVLASNPAAVVFPQTVVDGGPYWTEPGPTGNPRQIKATLNGQVLDFSYDFTDRNRGKYFNIAETIRQAKAFVDARRDPGEHDAVPSVTVQPAALTTFYNSPVAEIDLSSVATYTDMEIIHEYGHFIEAHIGSFAAIPSNHDGCTATIAGIDVSSPELAWMEGFSDWFAAAVDRAAPAARLVGFVDSSGYGTPFPSQLEAPYCSLAPGTPRGSVENYVSGVLWDLTDDDDPAESWDHATSQDLAILQIMDRELDAGSLPASALATIYRLAAAWKARGLPGSTLDTILDANEIVS
jgi:hypothetical protein